jgi:hypothetical protein
MRLLSRQQHEHEPEPECHAEQKKHLATLAVCFDPVALDLAQSTPELTAVDKSQVFALRLIRRKFAENPTDLIRCKFSIDARFRDKNGALWHVHHFETISPSRPETRHSPSGSNAPPEPYESLAKIASLAAGRGALAFA